jgi:hypothetical protein
MIMSCIIPVHLGGEPLQLSERAAEQHLRGVVQCPFWTASTLLPHHLTRSRPASSRFVSAVNRFYSPKERLNKHAQGV